MGHTWGRGQVWKRLAQAALREFAEETGLQGKIECLLAVSEVIKPEQPWHSVSITFMGEIVKGNLKPETGHRYGEKMPRWFSREEVWQVNYHPKEVIEKAFDFRSDKGRQ
ncbi:MAG TPA: NUDIX domain-containing protein [Anaerolineae bacterium]